MANKQRYTAQQVADVLTDAKGFISVAAKRLGCEQQTVRNYVDRYEVVRAALIDSRSEMDDFAESALFKLIQAGDTAATIFYAKTQLKHRGYSERLEMLTGQSPDAGPTQLQHVVGAQLAAMITKVYSDDKDGPGGLGGGSGANAPAITNSSAT